MTWKRKIYFCLGIQFTNTKYSTYVRQNVPGFLMRGSEKNKKKHVPDSMKFEPEQLALTKAHLKELSHK